MDFSQRLNSRAQRVNGVLSRLIDTLPFQNMPLVETMRYGSILGGKRLRPFLVYATGEMLGVDDAVLDIPAAAIECIHAYSLIHDDLPAMDNDDLRRGQPTCHIKFGEDNAILAGDALQTFAFEILSTQPMAGISDRARITMIAELATASGIAGMCGGQALDLAAESQIVSLADLEQIHRHKTGALIRSAVRLAAFSAGAAGHQALPALDRYAACIGLAFQVQDDILDVIGDTATLGKRQGADQQLGKSTYPALLGLEQAKLKAQDLYQEALSTLSTLSDQSLDVTTLQSLASYIIQRNK